MTERNPVPGRELPAADRGVVCGWLRWARAVALVVLATVFVAGAGAPVARADGDPGSDVLVFQDLFTGSASLSVRQQVQFGGLLKAAARAGFPVRVAIIASPLDLGAVGSLWRNPRAYARFLGLELSLAYKQRLLVVMPNGFGFNWPGHPSASAYQLLGQIPIGAGANGLLDAARSAVRKLAKAGGVQLPAVSTLSATASASAASAPAAPTPAAPAPAGPAPPTTGNPAGPAPPGRAADNQAAIIALALGALALAAVATRRTLRRRRASGQPASSTRWTSRLPPLRRRHVLATAGLLLALAVIVPIVVLANLQGTSGAQRDALAFNPELDPGTPVHGAAPDFTLSDQFGQPVSLHSFRGKAVILAFNDSECTTVCPLTTTAMLDAKAMLGKAGSQVQLLGIDANPAATSLEDVWSYSELHGMLHAWRFLTGTLPQLKQVWKRYGVEAAIENGQVTHTPVLFVIDPQGRLSRLYMTQMSYTAVPQLGQLLAQSTAALLPGKPKVRADLSYARIQPTAPTQQATLPRAGGGVVKLGPGRTARLFVFFASWDQATSGLAGELDSLNRYQTIAARTGLPALTAVDETSVEPNARTPTEFLGHLRQPLSYPVALDESGRLADGYEVLGLPWFVLTSPTGRLLYYQDVSTAGWPSTSTLVRTVKAALARVPSPTTPATALAGSPPPLAALHQQASRLFGSPAALIARVRALRGYPIVVNAWASWCGPCRSEFGLFASASARYGRRVAFLGADTNDSATDARSFLAQHPVSYPSYETTTTKLQPLAVASALPTTIFINSAGKVVFVHTGQYDSQGTLDQDISAYALGH